MKKEINDNKKPFRSLSNNYEVFAGNEYSHELLIPKNKRITAPTAITRKPSISERYVSFI